MSPLAQSLLATLAVSMLALVGIVAVLVRRPSQRTDVALLSFAAGVLLATSFLELIPEALAHGHADQNVLIASLVAMIAFFLLEWFLHGFHSHEESPHTHHLRAPRYLILLGDGLHNLIDGVAIAASFAAGPQLGIATTLAVAVHEIPQELADFGILVAGGFSRWRALALNFVSGLTAIVGALAFFLAAPLIEGKLAWFMAATAGMFIYIAGSDLIPQLHRHHRGLGLATQLPFIGGVVLIAALRAIVQH